jgi:CubicO group peptidase (beta-lactamase class C family)
MGVALIPTNDRRRRETRPRLTTSVQWHARLAVVLVLMSIPSAIAACGGTARDASPVSQWPTTGWASATPESEGLDSRKLADGLLAIRDRGLAIHSLTLVRHGRLLIDASFYPYDGSTIHDLASVTKSVTTSLVGIAVGQGKLRSTDRVMSFFPDRRIARRDSRKELMTVRDLASMTSGLDCTAENGEQTLRDMMASTDWVQFALDLPLAASPGSTYAYCSPGMHILSAILEKTTGMTEQAYAKSQLFGPLGIGEARWSADPQGHSYGWGDLALTPLDAAKFGLLWASDGIWDGRELIPSEWAAAATSVQATTGQSDDYGYGWWLPKDSTTGEIAAVGRGGQRIAIHRDLDLVIVVTGEGLEPSDATDLLAPALIDPENALPANPSGAADLEESLDQIKRPPEAQRPATLPSAARRISDATWAIDANGLDITSIRLSFAEPDQASIVIGRSDGGAAVSGRIGLDGVYLMSPGDDGLPVGMRGSWIDDHTFELDLDQIADNHAFDLRFRFAGDRLTIDGRDRTDGSTFALAGRRQ